MCEDQGCYTHVVGLILRTLVKAKVLHEINFEIVVTRSRLDLFELLNLKNVLRNRDLQISGP